MNMIECRVNTFTELDSLFEEYHRYRGWLYRGESDISWELQPKIARSPTATELWLLHREGSASAAEIEKRIATYKADGVEPAALKELVVLLENVRDKLGKVASLRLSILQNTERETLTAWKDHARRFLTHVPENDWEWLAVGQHHGLSTRLLDLTSNPLVAAFFALCEHRECDAAIYALLLSSYLDQSLDLGQVREPMLYKGPLIAERVVRQQGRFVVWGSPFDPLPDALGGTGELVKIIIPASERERIRRKIASLGVDRSTLFPDLDGAADHINWLMNNPALIVEGTPAFHQQFSDMRKEMRATLDRVQKIP